MELQQLQYLVHVADEGTFTGGAHRSHVVQSAVSASIARLERELGTAVFDRSGRRVALTPAGHVLLGHAREILARVRVAGDDAMAASGEVAGSVDLLILLSTGTVDLAGCLARVHAAHPGVRVRLRQTGGSSPDHVDEIVSGRADLGLVIVPDEPVDGLDVVPVGEVGVVLVCPTDDSLATARQVPVSDLAPATWIDFPAGWGNRLVADAALDGLDGPRRVAAEVIDVSTALGLVAGGLGVAFVPETAVVGRDDIAVVDLARPPTRSTIGVATSTRLPYSAATAAVRDALCVGVTTGRSGPPSGTP
ncbi:MAG: LysR family transcriptional regulator [Gordonia paraffinivorans]